jgi:putative membrane protein
MYHKVSGMPAEVRAQVNSDPKFTLLMGTLLPRLLTLTDAQHITALKGLESQVGDADKSVVEDAAGALGLGQLVASQLKTDLPGMVDQITTGVRDQLLAGLGTPTKGCDPTKTLRCGAAALASGGQQLADAVPQLTSGVNQLADGSQKLSTGAGQLSAGLGQADDGAHQLASGLGAAADGAGQIDDGLGQAAGGAPKLVAGLRQASNQGAKKIANAGDKTAKTFAVKYAELQVGAKRAHTLMAIGAPDGARGLVAYDFIIQGADGQGSRNVNRGLAAGGLLLVGAGGFLVRRRFI